MINIKPETPLYNHPLPKIEDWLRKNGCQQDPKQLNCWYVKKEDWEADITLEIEEIIVNYLKAGADGSDITRAFRYSLSRQDIEEAVFSGP